MLGRVTRRPVPAYHFPAPVYHAPVPPQSPATPAGAIAVPKSMYPQACPIGTMPGGCGTYYCQCMPSRGMFGLGAFNFSDPKTLLMIAGGAAVVWYLMKRR